MAILGLTHDARGTAVTRLPVTRVWITLFSNAEAKTVRKYRGCPPRTSQVCLRPTRERSELSLPVMTSTTF